MNTECTARTLQYCIIAILYYTDADHTVRTLPVLYERCVLLYGRCTHCTVWTLYSTVRALCCTARTLYRMVQTSYYIVQAVLYEGSAVLNERCLAVNERYTVYNVIVCYKFWHNASQYKPWEAADSGSKFGVGKLGVWGVKIEEGTNPTQGVCRIGAWQRGRSKPLGGHCRTERRHKRGRTGRSPDTSMGRELTCPSRHVKSSWLEFASVSTCTRGNISRLGQPDLDNID